MKSLNWLVNTEIHDQMPQLNYRESYHSIHVAEQLHRKITYQAFASVPKEHCPTKQ